MSLYRIRHGETYEYNCLIEAPDAEAAVNMFEFGVDNRVINMHDHMEIISDHTEVLPPLADNIEDFPFFDRDMFDFMSLYVTTVDGETFNYCITGFVDIPRYIFDDETYAIEVDGVGYRLGDYHFRPSARCMVETNADCDVYVEGDIMAIYTNNRSYIFKEIN